MAAGSAGTGIVWPLTRIVPVAVPYAMVWILTPACLAAAAALFTLWVGDWSPLPTVGLPSLISTMAAGAGLPLAAGGRVVMALSAKEMVSPVAVPPPGSSERETCEHFPSLGPGSFATSRVWRPTVPGSGDLILP